MLQVVSRALRSPLLLLCALLLTCKESPPGPDERTLQLSAVGVTCTEAWLRLQVTSHGGLFSILRDGSPILTFALDSPDTIILDEGLEPSRTYLFQARRAGDGMAFAVEASEPIPVRTLDTTGHNFIWEATTLGDGNSSLLYDVAIINDTLAYAVGAIYLNDSLGNWDPDAYNMVKWDGRTWELMRIPFISPCSAVDYPPLKAIWAISANQILVTNGGAIATFDGTTTTVDCRMNSLLTGAINKLYATNAQDIYAVGKDGNIIHCTSGTWRRLESGTTLAIRDIWGTVDLLTGQQQVLAVASNEFTNDGVAILQILPTPVMMLSTSGLPTTSLVGIWGSNGAKYYACGDGLYTTNNLRSSWEKLVGVPPIYKEGVRGNSLNDIIAVGDFGLILHWNGLTWREYSGSEVPHFQGQYLAVSIRGNTVVAVGFLNSATAITIVGRR